MPRGGNSRRVKIRRYRHNCRVRSRLLLVSWNAEGVLNNIGELSRWLLDKKVDVAALQEAQLAGVAITVLGYQTAAISRRARGRWGEGPVEEGTSPSSSRTVLTSRPSGSHLSSHMTIPPSGAPFESS